MMENEEKRGNSVAKVVQVADDDKSIPEQLMFLNLNKIVYITYIHKRNRYNRKTDMYDIVENYDPPKVYIKTDDSNSWTIEYADFEKFLLPYVSSLN